VEFSGIGATLKKLRMLLAATVLAGSMLVVAAPQASAKCVGEPNVCAVVCQIGLSNKYTHDAFEFCYVW
jgi:hypothetical protein